MYTTVNDCIYMGTYGIGWHCLSYYRKGLTFQQNIDEPVDKGSSMLRIQIWC